MPGQKPCAFSILDFNEWNKCITDNILPNLVTALTILGRI
jgi:hypothetical protein